MMDKRLKHQRPASFVCCRLPIRCLLLFIPRLISRHVYPNLPLSSLASEVVFIVEQRLSKSIAMRDVPQMDAMTICTMVAACNLMRSEKCLMLQSGRKKQSYRKQNLPRTLHNFSSTPPFHFLFLQNMHIWIQLTRCIKSKLFISF